MDELYREYFWIAWYSKGGYGFDRVMDMPFNDYEVILKEAQDIQKREKEATEAVKNG